MKGKSVTELNNVLHKDLIFIASPTCFFFIIIESATKEVLSTFSMKPKDNLNDFGLSFESVLVYILNEEFTTIPSALFNENKAKDYLSFTTSLNENSLVFHEKVDLEKLVVIWNVESQIKNRITDVFNGAIFKSVLSPFIEKANSYVFDHKISSLFFEDRLIISVFKKGELQLVNTFEIKSIEDALYYHLLLFQSTELKEEEIEIITGGIYKEIDLFVEKLGAYFSNINRIDSSIVNNSDNGQSFVEVVKSIN